MIRVLIVDDSEVVCRILSKEIANAPDMQVVGTATDPFMAREKILNLHPDVLTLDLEMPRMNGLTFLGRLMCFYPLPVVVVSAQTSEGSDTAMRALELGAVDVLGKSDLSHATGDFARSVVDKIRAAAGARCLGSSRLASAVRPPLQPAAVFDSNYEVLAVGASTGGTEAIKYLLSELPTGVPGIVLAQHMPEAFVARFAARLGDSCSLDVRVAKSGDIVTPGLVLVAPGNRHMILCSKGSRFAIGIKDGPAIHYQRPSIDVLFHSVAASAGAKSVGILLTGMGVDGARGLLAMREAGARTFAQDEQSCVVFGMPKEAIRLGSAENVVALSHMSARILEAISQKEPAQRASAGLVTV